MRLKVSPNDALSEAMRRSHASASDAPAPAAAHEVAGDLQVRAGAKTTSGAGDDEDANLRVVGGARDRVMEVVAHGAGKGVQTFRAVQGDPGDSSLHPQQYGVDHSQRSTIIEIPWPTPMHIVARP